MRRRYLAGRLTQVPSGHMPGQVVSHLGPTQARAVVVIDARDIGSGRIVLNDALAGENVRRQDSFQVGHAEALQAQRQRCVRVIEGHEGLLDAVMRIEANDRREDFFLGREIVVERRFGTTRARSDLAHRGFIKAVFQKNSTGRTEDSVADSFGLKFHGVLVK